MVCGRGIKKSRQKVVLDKQKLEKSVFFKENNQSMGHLDKIKEKNFVLEEWSHTVAGGQRGWQLSTIGEAKNSTRLWASC